MAVSVKKIQHNDYLEFVFIGPFDLNDAIDNFLYILKICKEAGIDKVLIDYRHKEEIESATLKGLYSYSIEDQYKKYLESGGHEIRFAYLAPTVLPWEPGIEIAERGKWPFKVFNKLNDALEWLNVTGT